MKKISRFLWWKLRKLFDVEILIEINFIRIFWRCIYFYNCVFSLNSSKNLQFFEYLRRNSYIRRSSKIFQNSEESSSSSLVYFPNPKILCLRLRSIFNLRCNTGWQVCRLNPILAVGKDVDSIFRDVVVVESARPHVHTAPCWALSM